MDVHSDPREEVYDVIVVGSGIGGLTAAALLAKAGQKVLVVEQGDGPGGYAHAFRRGPYLFDPAIHVTGQGGEGQLFDSVLRHLGVRDRCTMLPVGSYYAAHFPGFKFHAPPGLEAYIAAHSRHFPHEAEAIRQFFQLCMQVNREAHYLPPRLSLRDLDETAARLPTLFKHLKTTLGEVLDEHLTDPHLKAVCAAPWPYVGLPPSRLSFLTFCQMLASQVEGTFYSQGGFQNLVNAFVAALEQHGGELVVGKRAIRIPLQDGRVTGVTLEGGRQLRSSVVVSNADARQTFEELVGVEHLPVPFVRRLRRMQPSLSACVLFAATTLDLRQFDTAHETFFYKHWDHDETYQDILNGKPGGMWVNVPSLLDPSLAPAGEHILILSALAPYDIGMPWDQAKERYTEMLLDELDVIFPGVRDSLTFVETATPTSLERYTLNDRGAIYGWEYTPEQSGSKRLSHQTPVAGLYLSGHWTQPGAASLRVLVSGVHTAHIILADTHGGDGAPAFQASDLPPAFA